MKKEYYLVLFLITISCGKYIDPPYSQDFNKTRIKIGSRVIDSTFEYYKVLENDSHKRLVINRRIVGIKDSEGKYQTAKYIGKDIYLDDKTKSNIILEEDIYTSGKSKIGIDYDNYEYIFIQYIINNYKYSKPLYSPTCYKMIGSVFQKGEKYFYTYSIPSGKDQYGLQYYESKRIEISKKKLDSILISWNLKK
jgi:uncharacterized protein (UPF0333 family)